MRDVGLVGKPFAGKSTLFTALTRSGSVGGQANVAVVPVPDARLDVLTTMESSKKTVPAQVRFVDVPGGTSSAQGVAKLREVDALAIVVRCFGGDAKPAAELADVEADLVLADLAASAWNASKVATGPVLAVVAMVAWALQLMQAANDRQEFSLMLAGCESASSDSNRRLRSLAWMVSASSCFSVERSTSGSLLLRSASTERSRTARPASTATVPMMARIVMNPSHFVWRQIPICRPLHPHPF